MTHPHPKAWHVDMVLPDLHRMQEVAQAFVEGVSACLPGIAVGCAGPLGAGKTTWVRFCVQSLCADPELIVKSPTYTLLETYSSDKGVIAHLDLYRLESAEALEYLGWESQASALSFVEWFEHAAPLWQPDVICHFAYAEEGRTLRVHLHHSQKDLSPLFNRLQALPRGYIQE